ncbi:MAG: metal-dependent transcriptional regulator [Tissierellia bacterium]|nr:metal-dependent transcriptional regulator [Tissierellia bacterium]
MSPHREDYLKMIFELEKHCGYSSNKSISQGLGIAPASVTEMIRKLKDKDLVYSKGQKIYLTEEGNILAKQLLSRHRLWETFLMEKLGYLPSEVHHVAEILEHVTDETLINRLNDFLGKPKYCPHGGVIYKNGGELPSKTKFLFEGEHGEKGRIVRIYDRGNVSKLAEFYVLELYDPIEIIEKTEDRMILQVKEEEKSIPKELANHILIQIL